MRESQGVSKKEAVKWWVFFATYGRGMLGNQYFQTFFPTAILGSTVFTDAGSNHVGDVSNARYWFSLPLNPRKNG